MCCWWVWRWCCGLQWELSVWWKCGQKRAQVDYTHSQARGFLTNYTITLSPVSLSQEKRASIITRTVPASQAMIVVADLEPEQLYYITVAGSTSIGTYWTGNSEIYTCLTFHIQDIGTLFQCNYCWWVLIVYTTSVQFLCLGILWWCDFSVSFSLACQQHCYYNTDSYHTHTNEWDHWLLLLLQSVQLMCVLLEYSVYLQDKKHDFCKHNNNA